MRPSEVPQSLKDKLVGRDCTLNGKPATVLGRLNDFATIAPFDTSLGAFEWSWPAVERILAEGGNFKS